MGQEVSHQLSLLNSGSGPLVLRDNSQPMLEILRVTAVLTSEFLVVFPSEDAIASGAIDLIPSGDTKLVLPRGCICTKSVWHV